MSVQISSSTDTPEQVTAALGDLKIPTAEVVPVSEAANTEVEAKANTELAEAEALAEDDKELKAKEEGEKPEGKNRFKKRIDKERAIAAKAKEEMEFWKQEAMKSKSGAAESSSKPVETKVEAKSGGEPTADQFDTHAEYLSAFNDWSYKKNKAADDAAKKEVELKVELAKRSDAIREKIKDFAAKTADFNQAIEDVEDIKMSFAVKVALEESENAPELMYALAKDREEYARICLLPPHQAAREIGKFEQRLALSSPKEITETKITKAPKPLSPVIAKSSSSGKKSIDDPGLSQREYEKMRNEQFAQRRA